MSFSSVFDPTFTVVSGFFSVPSYVKLIGLSVITTSSHLAYNVIFAVGIYFPSDNVTSEVNAESVYHPANT